MNRLLNIAAVLVLGLALGLHWAALQMVAWTAMVVTYSREGAATGTFNDMIAKLGMADTMKQKIVLIAAILPAPEVMVLDEPMVGLDPQGMRLVKRVLREAADAGAVVLMSTHTLDIVEEGCDRVLVMGRGRLLADGAVAELVARVPVRDGERATLEDLFLQLTGSSEEVLE